MVVCQFRKFLVLFILGMLGILLVSPAAMSAVDVDPGRPDAFEVQVPNTAEAGIEFNVTIRVIDGEGNLVEDYDQLSRQIELSTTGSGTLSIREIRSTQFSDGTLSMSLTYDQAEEMSITVSEKDNVARGQSSSIQVRPGPPASFDLSVPSTARAGEPFTFEVIALDQFGNRVKNYDKTTNGLLVETDGVEKPEPSFLSVDQFQRGRLEEKLTYTVSENIRIIVIDEVNEIRETSEEVAVQPASLSEFTISVPGSATAGEPFKAAIEAKDRYGNIVTNYPNKERGVDVKAKGAGKIEPDFIPPQEFADGVSFTQFTYTKSGPLRVRVQDRGSSAEGLSDQINVSAGSPSSFRVNVPDEVEAGQRFDVSLEALDQYGNRVRNYARAGYPVALSFRGDTGNVTVLSPGQFDEGKATATVTHKQAGTIRVEVNDTGEGSLQGQSDPLVVVPSDPGSIDVEAPAEVTAGENFTVILQLQDEYGNDIKRTGSLAGEIHASILDHASGANKSFSANKLIAGRKRVTFQHETAEEVSVFSEYREYDIRSEGATIDVNPAPFDHFAIRTPGNVKAGQEFRIGLQMRDRFGNALESMPENLAPLHLFTTGDDNLDPTVVTESEIAVPNFTVSTQYYVAESMAIKIRDKAGKEVGVSPPIRVSPAELASFHIDVPDELRTTESFPIRLEARDAYNNVITNLNNREGNVALASTGSGDLSPQIVPYNQFVSGVAELSVDYHVAESIRILARGNGAESRTDKLTVQPGPPSRFDVSMQNRVQAGVPFPAVIEVFDEYDNRITELPSDFSGVQLQSNGARRISPKKISSSLFEDGRAEIYLAYPRTGPLSVDARRVEGDLSPPIVERFFVERDLNSGRIHLLSSHEIPASVERTPGSERIRVLVQPAELASSRQPANYQDWFVKKIKQEQSRFDPLPNVALSIYPQKSVGMESNFNQNLFTLELTASSTKEAGPTLDQVRGLIDDGDYEEASRLLDQYLDRHPEDQRATQLKHRLERVKELMSP